MFALAPSRTTKENLREEVILELQKQGYSLEGDSFSSKERNGEQIRKLHSTARSHRIHQNLRFLESAMHVAGRYMLDSSELDPQKIQPKLVEVRSGSESATLFRWWNLAWWSLPCEQAYGRQMRFLVWDKYHNAPIGLIGLQSPILRWKVRDQYLGITKETRQYWVNQSMNAQRLGALPPYNKYLGGKLVSLIMASNDIRLKYHQKYTGQETLIKKRHLPANLLFITTTGAYGKSSVYNRLNINDSSVCKFIGYSQGSGSFHIPDTLYEGFVNYLKNQGMNADRGWGNGPSTKIQIITKSMRLLGFKNGSFHGIRRAVYLFPFASNIIEVIHNRAEPTWEDRTIKQLTNYWQERWASKRLGNYPQNRLYFCKAEFLRSVELDLNRCQTLFE